MNVRMKTRCPARFILTLISLIFFVPLARTASQPAATVPSTIRPSGHAVDMAHLTGIREAATAELAAGAGVGGLLAGKRVSQEDVVWQQTNGPSGGEVLALAVSASGHLFAGTNGGGGFRTVASTQR